IQHAMKGGIGVASTTLPDGVVVAALAVVNCWGDVLEDGRIIAGARDGSGGFADAAHLLRTGQIAREISALNTTLAVVATNARFGKVELSKIAQLAHQGFTRTIAPVHTMFDGDLVFALSVGQVTTDLQRVGFAAADMVGRAVIRGVTQAEERGGVPSYTDMARAASP
ncbi:MAG: P1 family peptidase, partial [Candidatus Entotheonellia bacterium]